MKHLAVLLLVGVLAVIPREARANMSPTPARGCGSLALVPAAIALRAIRKKRM